MTKAMFGKVISDSGWRGAGIDKQDVVLIDDFRAASRLRTFIKFDDVRAIQELEVDLASGYTRVSLVTAYGTFTGWLVSELLL